MNKFVKTAKIAITQGCKKGYSLEKAKEIVIHEILKEVQESGDEEKREELQKKYLIGPN